MGELQIGVKTRTESVVEVKRFENHQVVQQAEGPTVDDALVGFRVPSLNELFDEMHDLGVPEFLLHRYDTGLWQVMWRHPKNSGCGSAARGRSAAAALRSAIGTEKARQRRALIGQTIMGVDSAVRSLRHLDVDDDARTHEETLSETLVALRSVIGREP